MGNNINKQSSEAATLPMGGATSGINQMSAIKPSSEAKKCKACCACPETKRIRDECIMQNGEENCKHLIEAHKACMRTLGFNI